MPRRTKPRSFVAIDGEAIEGKYAYIAAAGHGFEQGLWHPKGGDELSTLECLDFLFDVKAKTEGSTYVAFGLNYDVNMILRDLSRNSLEHLWTDGEVWISRQGASFHLQWIPRKLFQIYSPDRKQKIRIYDVFGFFQSSFVKALEAWQIDDPFDTVKKMKMERARFTHAQRKEIEKYCLSECHLLVELMDKLETSMRSANIFLRSYMGAGSAASAMLHREKVKAHRVSDTTFPVEVQRAIHCGYFGGRVEVMIQGVLNNVVNYDIVSAYPHQALSLPSLAGGAWREARSEEIEKPSKLDALWRVSWDIPQDSPNKRFPMPFPLRKKNCIYYPLNGSGWYHHCEVKAALQLHADYITVHSGFVFEPANDAKPFAFVREYFAARQAAKARGDAAEKAYKLAINSLYGKLAQGISYRGEPPFRSLYWAGKITAGTRARLLDCASLHPLGVVSMATDGIVFTGDPGIESSKELGGFERTEIDELFIAQPGIYSMQAEGQSIRKSRGFFTREIDYEDLKEGWLEHGPTYSQRAVCECGHVHTEPTCRCGCDDFSRRRRFVGLGTALARTDFSVWRTWQESDRILSLNSSRKFYATDTPGRVARLLPPSFSGVVVSEPYIPKTRSVEELAEMLEMLQGSEQPLENEGE